ncbi:MAG TPA: hypothetical protein VGK56_18380 [Anaerolineales bacterium]
MRTNEAVPEYSYRWWINQLDKDEKRLKSGFWEDGDKIVKKFKGKKNNEMQDQYLLNIFWANVRIMRAAIYGKKPRPLVNRMWQDQNDAVGRVAALMLERCLSFDLEKNKSPMDTAVRLSVDDWLIAGMGMVWFRYYAKTETKTIPNTSISVEIVSDEEVCCDYVHWRDLVWPSARTPTEVWYLARKIYMSKAEIKEKFQISVDKDDEGKVKEEADGLPKNFGDDKVCLYEIWCKKNRKIYWVCREIANFCKAREDFLELEDFYPAPMPLMANTTTDDYIPRADYMLMRDQYDQLNELNTRIVILEKAVRVVGVYDKKNAEVARVLGEARENDMIPVEKWAVLGEQGGLKGVVDWFPMDMIANVLKVLKEQKQDKKQEIYELSGISDIMRGASNPRETLGAQKLKAQFGSVSLESRQDELAQFVRRALSIKAEIMCRHFQPQTFMRLSNIEATPDAQMAEQAIALIKDTLMLHYRVDINEETLALPDYQQEQANRMEFLTTTGQFLSQSAQVLQLVPAALPTVLEMVRWVAAGFKGSNEIQGVLDSAFRAAQQPGAVQNPNGDPAQPEDVVGAEQVKQQGEVQKTQIQGEQKMKEIKLTKDLELRNLLMIEDKKQGGKLQEQQLDNQHEAAMVQHDDQRAREEMAHDDQVRGEDHEHQVELAQQSHENSLEQGEQSGNVQLEVSKLRGAGGNRSKNK